MIVAHTFKGQKIAVFGLGRTGVSAALSLAKGGADVHAWDDREPARKDAEAQGVPIKDLTLAKWSEFCLLYTSPSPRDATLSRMPSSA